MCGPVVISSFGFALFLTTWHFEGGEPGQEGDSGKRNENKTGNSPDVQASQNTPPQRQWQQTNRGRPSRESRPHFSVSTTALPVRVNSASRVEFVRKPVWVMKYHLPTLLHNQATFWKNTVSSVCQKIFKEVLNLNIQMSPTFCHKKVTC